SQNQKSHGPARRVRESTILRVTALRQWPEKTPGRRYFLPSVGVRNRGLFFDYHFYNIKGVFM
ncbi:TPA: hypothetical protein ID743_RS16070, partial [Escherichia coli]